MIGSLRGSLAYHSSKGIILDVGGVGYELEITAGVASRLGAIGDALSLVVFTDVKENEIALFGFGDLLEREVFLLLKKVKGIGSRTALSIISHLGAEALLGAIGNGEVSALQAVPGIGKKTAERTILELREQVAVMLQGLAVGPLASRVERITVTRDEPSISGLRPTERDAVLALEKLGIPAERAREVVAAAASEYLSRGDGVVADSGELLRLALKQLG